MCIYNNILKKWKVNVFGGDKWHLLNTKVNTFNTKTDLSKLISLSFFFSKTIIGEELSFFL